MTAYSQKNLAERILDRQKYMEKERSLRDDQTDVICELFRPDLVKGQVEEKDKYEFGGREIIEGTGPWSAMIWQRGFTGSMISRKSEWFRDKIKASDTQLGLQFKGNDEINQYLQDLDDHLSAVYRKSNYYDIMGNYVLDGGTVGSPVMIRERDVLNDRIICKVPDYSQVWLDKDIFGYDNVLHIKWMWNAIQAAAFFGKENLPRAVQLQLENGTHYEETPYLQVIYGAGDGIYDDLPVKGEYVKNKPWLEHFVCMKSESGEAKKLLEPKNKGNGYFHRPFSSWHYWRNWHEKYGRSMAWWAVYDVRGNNKHWEALFGEADLSLRPPVWALGTMRGLLDLAPAGENYANGVEEYNMPPMHLERKTRYQQAIDFSDRLKQAIERHFHVDLFMMANRLEMGRAQPETAYGIFKMDMERTAQLAPQVETYENQVLGDNHTAIIEMERMAEPAYPWGRLPKPPDILLEYGQNELDVEFIGQLSMSQTRDRKINTFFKNIGIAEMIFGFKPETVEKIKWSQTLERLMEAGNFPQADLVPEEEYQKMIEAVRQRAEQAQLAENAPKLTQAMNNLQQPTQAGSPLAGITQ